jgi:Zn-dependent protease with chaperone function
MFARADWLMLLAFTFPIQIVQPLLLLGSPQPLLFIPALLESALQIGLLAALVCALALIVDTVVAAFRRTTTIVPFNLEARLAETLTKKFGEEIRHVAQDIRVLPSDLSLGAHVRGFLRPQLVISGGMLVGLLRKTPSANAILGHELAHIQHFDRLFFGIIGLTALEFVGRFVKYSISDMSFDTLNWEDFAGLLVLTIYQIVVFGLLLSRISRYREYYADARAVQLLGGDLVAYRNVLTSGAQHNGLLGKFFHPSVAERLRSLDDGYAILRRVHFWKVYWVVAGSVAYLQWKFVENSFVEYYGYCGFVLAIALLLFELLRPWAIGSGASKRAFSSTILPEFFWNRTFLRRSFLLSGFVVVVVIADKLSLNDPGTIISIGGGIVYVVSRAIK